MLAQANCDSLCLLANSITSVCHQSTTVGATTVLAQANCVNLLLPQVHESLLPSQGHGAVAHSVGKG